MLSTGLGGISRGDATYRGSSMLLDDTATGRERFIREAAAGFVNPLRGINRLASGRLGAQLPNPDDPFEWRPPSYDIEVNLGARYRSDGEVLWNEKGYHAFADFELIYGNPYENERMRPWDRFDVYAEGNIGERATGTASAFLRDELDLHARTHRQGGHAYGRARRRRGGEPRRVRLVHLGEVVHVGQVHVHLDDVVRTEAAVGQDREEVVEALVRLRFDPARAQRSGRRIDGRLTRAEHVRAVVDRVGIWADRRGGRARERLARRFPGGAVQRMIAIGRRTT